jgi:hypothetical protein
VTSTSDFSLTNSQPSTGRLARLLLPSFSDCLFIAVLVWLFATGAGGWYGLLADGDTGWHIRTGEWILQHRQVPQVDLYSFSKSGQPWFAWEWLADVVFAALHQLAGLKGVLLVSAIVISGYGTLLFRHMIARGVLPFAALLTTLLCFGASTVHFLARPHIFTMLGLTGTIWLLENDRAKPSRRIWLLVPITILWTNVHGGFLALIATLGLLAAGTAIEEWWKAQEQGHTPDFRPALRYGVITACCTLASLVNPFGWKLHQHVFAYMQSDWIKESVQEFQSPSFRTESALQFEIVLFLGLITVAWLISKRMVVPSLWILFWGHNALMSVRHIPIFMIVAAPWVALGATELWRRYIEPAGKKTTRGILASLSQDMLPGCSRSSMWIAVVVAQFVVLPDSLMKWPADFPDIKFPARMAEKHRDRLIQSRVLTMDQWADYLIYRYYPNHKVFIDGRSDFYGERLGKEYVNMVQASHDWDTLLDKHGFDTVLSPAVWSLATILKRDSRWRMVDDDGLAILFERVPMQRAAAGDGRKNTPGGPVLSSQDLAAPEKKALPSPNENPSANRN